MEIDRIDEIYNADTAEQYGLLPGDIVVQIHTGSRGLGHQVATDSIRVMTKVVKGDGSESDGPARTAACR